MMSMLKMTACNKDFHCTKHCDDNDSNHRGNRKLHARARIAAPALPRPSVAPMLQLLQPPQPDAIPPIAVSHVEREVVQFGTQQESGRDMVCKERWRRRHQTPIRMEFEGVGATALHAGV